MTEDKACRELEPCPFCGGGALDDCGVVACDTCGAMGAICETDAETIAAWNHREEKPAVPEGFRLIPSDAVAMLLHKFERAGGPFKVAHFGVELGASSWASNVENALAALSAAPTPPEVVKEPTT